MIEIDESKLKSAIADNVGGVTDLLFGDETGDGGVFNNMSEAANDGIESFVLAIKSRHK